MYCCALCGKFLFQKKIFCPSCLRVPDRIFKRNSDYYVHYYFYKWNTFSKALISNLKNAHHLNSLDVLSPYFQYIIRKELGALTYNYTVLAAPNSKQVFFEKNHAYQLAKAFGFKDPQDIMIKIGEQKRKTREQRKRVDIDLKIIKKVKNLIVIDDVLTTGATMEAIYHLLKPSKMLVFSLAYVESDRL